MLKLPNYCRKKQPDILFLDIILGEGTGFDILEIIPNLKSKIIFVTASDAFAIQAFKFATIDYILKTYSDEDLAFTIEKAQHQTHLVKIKYIKEFISSDGSS